jgi:hypothetical protein
VTCHAFVFRVSDVRSTVQRGIQAELDMLKGSPTFSASRSLRTKLEREYGDLVERVFNKVRCVRFRDGCARETFPCRLPRGTRATVTSHCPLPAVFLSLPDQDPSKFPREKYTFELFLWAFVMLFSRAARLSLKIGGEELALVPYADLMNHNPYR